MVNDIVFSFAVIGKDTGLLVRYRIDVLACAGPIGLVVDNILC